MHKPTLDCTSNSMIVKMWNFYDESPRCVSDWAVDMYSMDFPSCRHTGAAVTTEINLIVRLQDIPEVISTLCQFSTSAAWLRAGSTRFCFCAALLSFLSVTCWVWAHSFSCFLGHLRLKIISPLLKVFLHVTVVPFPYNWQMWWVRHTYI